MKAIQQFTGLLKSFERIDDCSSERLRKSFERLDVFNKRVSKSFERLDVFLPKGCKSFERLDVFDKWQTGEQVIRTAECVVNEQVSKK